MPWLSPRVKEEVTNSFDLLKQHGVILISPLGSHCHVPKGCLHSSPELLNSDHIIGVTFQFRDAPFNFHKYLINYIHGFWVYLNFCCLTVDALKGRNFRMVVSSLPAFLFLLFQGTMLEKSMEIRDKIQKLRWHDVLWGSVQFSFLLCLISTYWYPEMFSICTRQLDWESGMKRS